MYDAIKPQVMQNKIGEGIDCVKAGLHGVAIK